MVTKIQSKDFETKVKASPVAVVDFSATWCGPCRMLAPVLEDVSEKFAGKADFYHVDVDEAPDLAAAFRVNSVPCLVLLKNGTFADQSVGFRPGPQIAAWIESNL